MNIINNQRIIKKSGVLFNENCLPPKSYYVPLKTLYVLQNIEYIICTPKIILCIPKVYICDNNIYYLVLCAKFHVKQTKFEQLKRVKKGLKTQLDTLFQAYANFFNSNHFKTIIYTN